MNKTFNTNIYNYKENRKTSSIFFILGFVLSAISGLLFVKMNIAVAIGPLLGSVAFLTLGFKIYSEATEFLTIEDKKHGISQLVDKLDLNNIHNDILKYSNEYAILKNDIIIIHNSERMLLPKGLMVKINHIDEYRSYINPQDPDSDYYSCYLDIFIYTMSPTIEAGNYKIWSFSEMLDSDLANLKSCINCKDFLQENFELSDKTIEFNVKINEINTKFGKKYKDEYLKYEWYSINNI